MTIKTRIPELRKESLSHTWPSILLICSVWNSPVAVRPQEIAIKLSGEGIYRVQETAHSKQKKVAPDISVTPPFKSDLTNFTRGRNYSAPTFGRHLSKRCSIRSNTSVMIMPLIAKIKTPTNTLSVWNVAPATVIMKPMPAVAA